MTDQRTLRVAGYELVVASFVVLFLELALIRWLPGQVRVLAYFPNLVLISSFLGLGVGALRARRRSLLFAFPLLLVALLAAAWAGSKVAFTAEGTGEHLWLLYYDLPKSAPTVDGVRLPIVFAFVLTAAVFAPLGQLVGARLAIFRGADRALTGYALDLGGSLAGVLAFAAVASLRTFPVVWFAIVLAAAALFFRAGRGVLAAYAAAAAVALFVVHRAEKAEVWSPYYAIATVPTPDGGFEVLTNGSLHQRAIDLRHDAPSPTHDQQLVGAGYHLPYRLLASRPRRVLVLGAGTGNDVAVALDEGAEEVHVVEIDPEILALGRRRHPAHPYDSPRVVVHQTDARAFLQSTPLTFDLIVFGTLDSMTRLSALSNVRLDNFVYTADAMRAARARLSPTGGLVLMFMVGKPYVHENIEAMLTHAFGEPPHVYARYHVLFNRIYMEGPAFARLRDAPELHDARVERLAPLLPGPTDDWPYLYLSDATVSPFYLSLMAALAICGAVAVALASRELRAGVARGRVDVEMALFGAAFLLLEGRYVTEMNLVWGATWITSVVVFGAILLTVLGSTLLMRARRLPFFVCLAGLLLALAATWVVPSAMLVGRALAVRLALSIAYVGTPVFFAATCFALRFETREDADVAFGWNLVGAVAGGLAEFLAMALGLKALVLVAACAYLGVALLVARGRRAVGLPAAGEPATQTSAS